MKQVYVTVILVFCLQFGFGQIGFEENIVTDAASSPVGANSVYSVDIDNDGDMDVLSASSDDDKIAWYENIDGQGLFGNQQIISLNANNAQFVYAVDLDNDGDFDVLSASANDSKIAWYENMDGQGGFSEQQIINNNLSGVQLLSVADIDNDGHLDVVSSSSFLNKIVWFKHIDGQGTFGNEQIVAANAEGARSVYAEDIDDDGDMDIISAYRGDDNIAWYENLNGFGDFSSEQIITTIPNGARSLYIVDFDNDADLDILSASAVANKISWFENIDGQGTFGSEHLITANANGALSVYASDVDNDGDLDVFSASSVDNKIAWYENLDSDGSFGTQQIITTNANSARLVYATDIDNDGDIDVLSASSGDSKIAWYENTNGLGGFGSQQVIVASVDKPILAISVDIDNDGDNDIISSSTSFTDIVWYENTNGEGNYRNQRTIADETSWFSSIFAIDIDGDGDMDVLASSPNTDKISWYKNTDGLGSFGNQQIISVNADAANSVYATDLDNDGDIDVLSASGNDDKIAWYENIDGQGIFGTQQIISTSANNANSVYAADIDGDGDMDVLSSSSSDDKIAWYENTDGQGSFGPQQIISTNADAANTVFAADIDGDNDLDVLSSSGIDDKIAWYENTDGQGAIGPEQVITLNAEDARSIYAADLDNDGDVDILSSSFGDDKIAWYENLGNNFNQIQGVVRSNLDSNGCDDSDITLANILITSNYNNGTTSSFTDENGFYQIIADDGEYYTTPTQLATYYISTPAGHTSNFTNFNNLDIANFCLEPTQTINDLEISLYPLTEARPGYDVSYQIIFKNVGTTSVNNGFITLDYNSSIINFQNSSESIFAQSSSSLVFQYIDLQPFETKSINLNFLMNNIPLVMLGDILSFDVEITPFTQDQTIYNNSFTLEQTVIGSYDPNDITVLEGEEIAIEEADKYLHYLIRFQNTGTASAITVRVENVLDEKLDWTTIQLESLSHTGRVEITDETDVSFIFNNINLADSTSDEPNSHGYIAYKIKPKSNVEVGDIISGTADIFFDFNPPITTNTVNTEIVESLSFGDYETQIVKLFPNPTNNKLEITSSKIIDKLTVIDINGRTLNEIQLSKLEYNLDVSSLTKGVYFLEIQSGNTKIVKRFIKS